MAKRNLVANNERIDENGHMDAVARTTAIRGRAKQARRIFGRGSALGGCAEDPPSARGKEGCQSCDDADVLYGLAETPLTRRRRLGETEKAG